MPDLGPCVACGRTIEHGEARDLIELIAVSRSHHVVGALIHWPCFERSCPDRPSVSIGGFTLDGFEELPPEIAEIETPQELRPMFEVALDRTRTGVETGDAGVAEDGLRALDLLFRRALAIAKPSY